MPNVIVHFVETRSNRPPVAIPSGLTPLAHAIHRNAVESGRTEATNWLAVPDPTGLDSLADEWVFAWQPESRAALHHAQSARLTCLLLARLLDHLTWASTKLERIAAISAYAQRMAAATQAELIAVAPEAEALLPALLTGWMTNEMAARWALWQISRAALRQPAVLSVLQRYSAGDAWAVLNMSAEADDFIASVSAWAQTHGRRVSTLDTMSAWEAPAQVIAAIQSLLQQGKFDDYVRDAAREAAENQICDEAKAAVRTAQQCWVVARDAEWTWQQFLCEMRLIVRELGRRLARAGVIEKSADAFYLTLDELLSAASGLSDRGGVNHTTLVARRKLAAQITDRA